MGIAGTVILLSMIFLLAKGKINTDGVVGKKLFMFYLGFAIFNMVTCFYFRHQDFITSLKGWTSLLLVFYYFTFRTWNYSISFWEKVIFNMFVFILVLYVLKYMFIDVHFIKLDTEDEYLNYESRVRIFSDGFLTLGYMFCLNKYLALKKKRFLLLAISGFVFIFLQGFRTLVAAGIISTVIMTFRMYKLTFKSIIFISFAAVLSIVALYTSPMLNDKVMEMTSRNETQNFDNDDYIRTREILYFYNEFFQSDTEMFWGAGRTPFGQMSQFKGNFPSEYSRERSILATDYHFYPVDLGFIGLSWETGIPFTIVAVLLFLNLWTLKVDKQYLYISCYGLYMVLIGFTMPQGIYHNNLICLAIIYTIYEVAHRDFLDKSGVINSINKLWKRRKIK